MHGGAELAVANTARSLNLRLFSACPNLTTTLPLGPPSLPAPRQVDPRRPLPAAGRGQGLHRRGREVRGVGGARRV